MKLFASLLDKTPLTFGKHQGRTPEEIANGGDQSYIVWLYENVNPKKCSKELYLACEMDDREEKESHNFGE